MITPQTMTWEEVLAASDEEIVAAYMDDGMAREQAEAFVAELRGGWLDYIAESTPEWCQGLGMNPGPIDYMAWDMKSSDRTPAEILAARKIRNVLASNRAEAHLAILDAGGRARGD